MEEHPEAIDAEAGAEWHLDKADGADDDGENARPRLTGEQSAAADAEDEAGHAEYAGAEGADRLQRGLTEAGVRRVLRTGAASILQMNLGRVGGILEAKKIAGMAETHYAQIAPHLYCGPLVGAANVQIAACSPNFLIIESIRDWGGFHAEILKTKMGFEDGHVIIPTAPGLGVELDQTKLTLLGEVFNLFNHYNPDVASLDLNIRSQTFGMIGGGVNALRGHSNVQGITDLALLSTSTPGYLVLPTDKEATYDVMVRRMAKWATERYGQNPPWRKPWPDPLPQPGRRGGQTARGSTRRGA